MKAEKKQETGNKLEKMQKQLDAAIDKVDGLLKQLGAETEEIEQFLNAYTDEKPSRKIEQYISNISKLFPPDSKDNEIAEIGQTLLGKAILRVWKWERLPIAILEDFSDLCLAAAEGNGNTGRA